MVHKPEKATMILGAGAAVGVSQTVIFREYLGPIPVIGDYIPHPWGNWSSLGNIIIGGIAFGVSQFTDILKNHRDFKGFLLTYGMTTLIGGFMNGILAGPAALRAAPFPATLVGQGPGAYITSDYYPGFRGTFVRRPQSPARGYGSDVTRNPMASIPTKVPTNKILA